jgi:single-stranded-DNA-specific exonuclease
MKARWSVRESDQFMVEQFSRALHISESLSSILSSRGIRSVPEAYRFLDPRISHLQSPFAMKGMREAVIRIRRAVERGERVGIFADSDLDGITSLAVALQLLERFRLEVHVRYPVGNENYGLTEEIIDEMREEGVTLLLTLDSGIRDVSEIASARQYGIDAIVCDHHEPDVILPDAIVVNPKQDDCRYPFKDLAGVGVAFKLCHAVLMSYCQSYDVPFLLITRDDDTLWAVRMLNGVCEAINEYATIDDLGSFIESDEAGTVVYDDLGKDINIQELLHQRTSYRLSDLVSSAEASSTLTLDEIGDLFSLRKEFYHRKIDFLTAIFAEMEYTHTPKIKDFLHSVIGLVALGTIADIVPLVGENRTLVSQGMQSLVETEHLGMSYLLRNYDIISSKVISWSIAPLLNAPGRFGETELIARFFIEKEQRAVESIVDAMVQLNEERKSIVSAFFEKILCDIEAGAIDTTSPVFFVRADIPEGLSGLVANRISETLNKPVIVVSQIGESEYVKGSGRALEAFNFLSFVEPFAHLFERYGGHEQAFGFTARLTVLDEIQRCVEQSASGSYGEERFLEVDLEIPLDVVDMDFVRSLSVFEPHGHQNGEITFLSRGVEITDYRPIGRGGNHGIYVLKGAPSLEAVGWNKAAIMEEFSRSGRADMVYHLELHTFNGLVSPRLVILDMGQAS